MTTPPDLAADLPDSDPTDEASDGAKLTAKQQKAIEVLLVGGTDAQAAQAAGVARTTVNEWRNHHAPFASALLEARTEMLNRMRSRLHAATGVAVRTLEEVARDVAAPASRVAAARALLEFSTRALELEEVELRLRKLEAVVAERSKSGW